MLMTTETQSEEEIIYEPEETIGEVLASPITKAVLSQTIRRLRAKLKELNDQSSRIHSLENSLDIANTRCQILEYRMKQMRIESKIVKLSKSLGIYHL